MRVNLIMDDTEERPSDYEAHTEVPLIMDDLLTCITHEYYISHECS